MTKRRGLSWLLWNAKGFEEAAKTLLLRVTGGGRSSRGTRLRAGRGLALIGAVLPFPPLEPPVHHAHRGGHDEEDEVSRDVCQQGHLEVSEPFSPPAIVSRIEVSAWTLFIFK